MFGGAAYNRVVMGWMDEWSVVSKCDVLHNVPSRRQWSICMDTFHTMALPSHCCIVFEKEKRNTKCHYEWLQKFESAKPGYALGALFGFLVLIMSRVLPVGILGLGCTCILMTRNSCCTERRSSLPSPSPAMGHLYLHHPFSQCSCLCSHGASRAECGAGWWLWEAEQFAERFFTADSCSSSLLSPRI